MTPPHKRTEDRTELVDLLEEPADWKKCTDALDRLYEWHEELLDTETELELFRKVIDIAREDLHLSAATIYCFDEETAKLRPKATSIATADPVSPGENLVWKAFKSETVTFPEEKAGNDGQNDEYRFAIPFGERSVLAGGEIGISVENDKMAKIVRMLCDTAAPQLERMRYEKRLQERDRKLQQQTQKLEQTERIAETYRAVVKTAASAETRENLDTEVCGRFVENDSIEFAWIGEVDRSKKEISPRAWAGSERGYLERAPIDLDADGELTAQAARNNEVTVVDNVASGPRGEQWRFGALERRFKSAIAVPLSDDGILHGVLTAYADRPNAFEGATALASDMGALIGHAITAIQCQNGLLAHTSTELDVRITAPACFFVRFVRETKTSVSFEAMSPTGSGSVLVFVRADDPEQLIDHAERSVAVRSVQLLEGDADGDIVQGQFDNSFIGAFLSYHGIALQSASATPEEVRVTVSIPPTMDPRRALEIINSEYPDSKLLAKRDSQHRDGGAITSRLDPFDRLTERQREVAERAYREGYFETPKEATSETLAESMDISTSAFHNHLRSAEAELFSWLFDTGTE